jgi:hypothetical protein
MPRGRNRVKHAAQFSTTNQPAENNKGGRPKGTTNKISRTMKDAAIEAANELGEIDYELWPEHLKGCPGQGMKQFFKVLAVKELRTFAIILARFKRVPRRDRNHPSAALAVLQRGPTPERPRARP